MYSINLRSFRLRVKKYKHSFKLFLSRTEKNPPKRLHKIIEEIDQEIWAETDCLTCGNCCKKMTPTFNKTDIQRISNHLGMTAKGFKEKWLVYIPKDKEYQNKKQPCQFIDLQTNKCSIYPVRPSDCAGFPHLTKKKTVDYIHVHKQNIEYCPATFRMVERLKEVVEGPVK